MKKSIVLLITLFFISAISILVLKNLDDTDKFLEKQNHIINNTQILLAVKNTQKEISKLLTKYKSDIDKAVSDEVFTAPFLIKIEGLDINFKIKKYSRIDINKIEDKKSKSVQSFFYSNDIFDYDIFKNIFFEKLQTNGAKVGTNKQVDDIINTFIKRVENQDILKVRDDLGFTSKNDLYELYINVTFQGLDAIAYYILTNDGKVEYFDISFK